VTEVGRQPWIVYGVLRTADAVTPVPGLVVPFVTFTLLYCLLGVITAWLLYRQIVKTSGGGRSRYVTADVPAVMETAKEESGSSRAVLPLSPLDGE
jgi:cytochrome d ubiquinol oxidase subunit I